MVKEYELNKNGEPTILEFHLTSGKKLKFDLSQLRVEFWVASNRLFMNDDYEKSPDEILKAITDLKSEDSIYIYTEVKEDSETYNATSEFDRKRTYLTQRSKIAYIRVSHK